MIKNDRMVNLFLNWAKFWQLAFSTLAPPSSYNMNLKTLTKESKASWASQLSYELLLNETRERIYSSIFSARAEFSVSVLCCFELSWLFLALEDCLDLWENLLVFRLCSTEALVESLLRLIQKIMTTVWKKQRRKRQ